MPYKKNGLFGVVDAHMNFIISPKFDEIEFFSDDFKYFKGWIGDSIFIINSHNKKIYKATYDPYKIVNDSTYINIRNHKENVYIEGHGFLFPSWYNQVQFRNNHYTIYENNDSLFYYSLTDKKLERCRAIRDYQNITLIEKDNATEIYDSNFTLLSKTPLPLKFLHPFGQDKYLFFSSYDQYQYPTHYLRFGTRIHSVSGESLYDGAEITVEDDPLTQLIFISINNKENSKWTTNDFIINQKRDKIFEEKKLKIISENKNFGIKSNDGKEILNCEFSEVTIIKCTESTLDSNYILLARKNNKWGVFSLMGEELIPPNFSRISSDNYHHSELYLGSNQKISKEIISKYSVINGLHIKFIFENKMIYKTALKENCIFVGSNGSESGQPKYIEDKKGKRLIGKNEFIEWDYSINYSTSYLKKLIYDENLNHLYGITSLNGEEILPTQYHGIRILNDTFAFITHDRKHAIYNMRAKQFTIPFENDVFYTNSNWIHNGQMICNNLIEVIDRRETFTKGYEWKSSIYDISKKEYLIPKSILNYYVLRGKDVKFLLCEPDYISIIDVNGKTLFKKTGKFSIESDYKSNFYKVICYSNCKDKNTLMGYIDLEGHVYFD